MKRIVFVLIAIATASVVSLSAQKKKDDPKLMEDAVVRYDTPKLKTFIMPQIADIKMLSEEREKFGPYKFEIKSVDNITEWEMSNAKARATYRAAMESDADVIIEPMYDAYVLSSDSKTLSVEVSGYPAKYINFRPLGQKDTKEVDMVRIVYTYNEGANSVVTVPSNSAQNTANTTNTK